MTQDAKDAPVFTPFVWGGHVVLNEDTQSTIRALAPALEVDEDGKPANQAAYDATIGLLKASGGITPASLSVAGDGFDVVMAMYLRDWAGGKGSEQFDVYLSRLNEFTENRRKAYGLAYMALADRDYEGNLMLHGHATKAPMAKSWAAAEDTSPVTTVHYRPVVLNDDGEVKVKARWDYEIIESNPEAVNEFDLIEAGHEDAMSSLVAFLTEREEGSTVVDLMKRASLRKDGFVISAPVAPVVQRTTRTGRGVKMTAQITLLNGTVVDLDGSSSEIGLAAAKAALEADPNLSISKTDRYYNPTGKNPDIPRGYAGSWISGEKGALARCAAGEKYTRSWLRDVQIAVAA